MKKQYPIIISLLIFCISLSHGQEVSPKNERKKGSSFSFVFWNASDNDKSNKEKPRNKKDRKNMQIFDTHAIFGMDTEIEGSMDKTKELRKNFKKESQLIEVQIKFLEKELIELLDQQRQGTDNSEEILSIYTSLYKLCNASYDLKNQHTRDLYELFSNSYKNYTSKIEKKIQAAQDDNTQLVSELLERYKMSLKH